MFSDYGVTSIVGSHDTPLVIPNTVPRLAHPRSNNLITLLGFLDPSAHAY